PPPRFQSSARGTRALGRRLSLLGRDLAGRQPPRWRQGLTPCLQPVADRTIGGVDATLIPATEYRRERWGNGLGWTREVARHPVDGVFDWRGVTGARAPPHRE